MKRFCCVAVALAAMAPVVAHARCSASWPPPTFAVSLEEPPVVYDFTEDSAGLVKTAGKNGMPSLGQGEIPYGITIGRYGLEVVAETDSTREGAALCTHLRSARATIGLKQLEVVVDRRFGAGSCQRQAILDHESQHVEIFREAMRFYEPALEQALGAATLPQSVSGLDREVAREAFLKPLTEAEAPIFEAINARARDRNSSLDTTDTYKKVFKQCASW